MTFDTVMSATVSHWVCAKPPTKR
jgi:hypothetical protein